MGLRSDVQESLAEAMLGDLSDVVETFNFVTNVVGAYDADSDSYSKTPTNSPSKGIFVPVDSQDIDGINVMVNDEICVVNGVDALIEPRVNMIIELADGKEYRIINPGKVMGGNSQAIVYTMLVRRNESAVR